MWLEPFEPVAVAGGAPGLPQMSHATGPYGPLPRVYYLADHEGQASLVYRTKQLETGWDGPFRCQEPADLSRSSG